MQLSGVPHPSPQEIDRMRRFEDRRSLRLDLGGLVVDLEDLPAALAGAAARRYAPFSGEISGAPPDVTVAVHDAERDHFIAPAEEPRGRVYRLSTIPLPGGLNLVGHGFAGWFRIGERRGGLALCRGSFDPPERALENFVRACFSWAALERGGFLLHSASILRADRAFLFFGASGAGKSTLASLDAGGRVVSDDLTLVLPRGADRRLHVVGSPFRGTYTGGAPVAGHHLLHSAYRLRQNERTFVAEMQASAALAALVANLTFVVDVLRDVPGLAERIEPRLRAVPTYELHFRKEPGFWRALEAFHGDLAAPAP